MPLADAEAPFALTLAFTLTETSTFAFTLVAASAAPLKGPPKQLVMLPAMSAPLAGPALAAMSVIAPWTPVTIVADSVASFGAVSTMPMAILRIEGKFFSMAIL